MTSNKIPGASSRRVDRKLKSRTLDVRFLIPTVAGQNEVSNAWASEGGTREGLSPWILKILTKKGCLLSFVRKKTNFTTFRPFLEKFGKIPSWPPTGKNPSDAHGRMRFDSQCIWYSLGQKTKAAADATCCRKPSSSSVIGGQFGFQQKHPHCCQYNVNLG